jgi:NAD(P)-dependent dehydrogenase (short-subunit alcohol dehydrogenase family)
MAMDFEDKIVLITGAGKGIGEATAKSFASQGAVVVINDLDEAAAKKVSESIIQEGGRAMSVCADITRRDQVYGMVDRIERTYETIHILVNNAGVFIPKDFFDLDDETWDKTFSVNVKGMFLCSQAVSPLMIHQNYGRIINLSSIQAKIPSTRYMHYCSAKASVIHFTRVLALILAPNKITVNAVAPGPTGTEMLDEIIRGDPQMERLIIEGDARQFRIGIPLGRIATPEDQAKTVLFLASEAAGHITGQTIHVDGGQSVF